MINYEAIQYELKTLRQRFNETQRDLYKAEATIRNQDREINDLRKLVASAQSGGPGGN